jgi:uncharacterized membrane protein (DUF2068 family)
VADGDGRETPSDVLRLRSRFPYELIGCGLRGHELVGTQAARLRPGDALLARESADGLRWYRCLRCDAWVPLPRPTRPTADHLPDRDEITLPLRGRPLRDRWVLRLIALDRVLHCLVLAILAAAVFVFVDDRAALRTPFFRIADAMQAGVGGPTGTAGTGILGELERAFAARPSTLVLAGVVLTGYAVLEGLEAVGLWRGRRWAEYLTFVATALLLIPELYELAHTVTPLKVVALVINLAVVAYLLVAKRLFGLRGGARAEAAERSDDTGWAALERSTPAGSAPTTNDGPAPLPAGPPT